jgi:sigma-B regulation protein RsbU (phosphoserine phosphatase)
MVAASSGIQALDRVINELPDLILLDVVMPGMSGYEVCRKVRANPETAMLPVIMVTALDPAQERLYGIEAGADDFLTKPINQAELVARVRSLLRVKELHDTVRSQLTLVEAAKARMEEELNVGRDIQMSMLPRIFPAFSDRKELDLYAVLEPAKEVGGDFYDFFMIDENRLCFSIGDVSGKGVPAALFMAMTKTMLKSRAASDLSPASIVTHVNDIISVDNVNCMFVTLYMGILNLRDGTLVTTNAGHNLPLLKRQGGRFEWLEARDGPIVGPFPGIAFKQTTTRLEPGDEFLLYTDGVTEADNVRRELFGKDRLKALLDRATSGSVVDRIRDVMQAVKTFAGDAPQADDIAMLALLYNGVAPSDASAPVFRQTMPNQLIAIPVLQTAFEHYVAQWEGAKPLIPTFNMALDDLLSNVVQYGFPNDPAEHSIEVQGEVYEDFVKLTITDDGIPFNPLTVKTPDLSLPLHESKIGGLGIHLVRSMFDEVSYHRTVGHNVVTIKKKLAS